MTDFAEIDNKKRKQKQKKRVVTDQYGAEYECIDEKGVGGQGKVWSTNHQNTLVKTFRLKDTDKRKRWFDHVQWVLRQDLEGLCIAAPKALVTKPVPGYVMELMDGLHSLSDGMQRSLDALAVGEGLAGFLNTGGLRRRLLMLSHLADTLARLHAKGLAYGDLSPSNIFVSESVRHSQVWLIDCDNICTNERTGWEHLYTPSYGAPEVVRGESGVNSLTDAWSFAVIAYQLLTTQHPLKGELVDDGEDELEEQAYRGEIPWVRDLADDSNAPAGGIPMEMVASKQMQVLFHRSFGEGKQDAGDRPTMSEWRSAIDEAVALIIDCHDSACRSSFIRSSSCPFCSEEPSSDTYVLLTALVYSDDPELERKLLKTGYGRVVNLDETVMFKRSPAGTSVYHESDEVFQILLTHEALTLKVVPGQKVTVMVNGKPQDITQGLTLSSDKKQGLSYFVHLTPSLPSDDISTHPVWAFSW